MSPHEPPPRLIIFHTGSPETSTFYQRWYRLMSLLETKIEVKTARHITALPALIEDPTTILIVADSELALPKNTFYWDIVLAFVYYGGICITACEFYRVDPEHIAPFFARAGLSWTSGLFRQHRRFEFNPAAEGGPEGGMLDGRAPQIYRAGGRPIWNVEERHIWYSFDDSGEGPRAVGTTTTTTTTTMVAMAGFGRGWLGYTGSKGSCRKTIDIIVAMCGLSA
ncbi:hypothetical protein N7466_004298 [Penicillium verhagenii]|uniref:uncharacterized protein n=1 Tax=Penicillium verhagenii TaxID=1562060 RepID=UPI002545456E|nr:uncharacterized protein N7466_004298 [Penicillium verhagenii]KAJ5934751.1 hypothetical protein N7466_004298 [Penicillium verhagenii]